MPHPWPVFPPEENYTALTSGTGPATTLASAAAFTAEAAQLQSVMATSMVTGVGTYASWHGSAAAASAVTQTGLNTQHELLAGWVLEKPPLVTAAAEAHQTAVAMMVPAAVAVANRMEEATDEQINPLVWGALTPRIVALNLDYFGHMWPRNAGAGAGYGATLRASAAAMMVPPPPAVAGGAVAAPAIAAAAVAENVVLSAAGAAMQAAEQGAMAVVSPAAATPAAGLGAMTSSASSVSSTPTLSSPPAAQPMAAVQHASPPARPMAPVQAPMGMFAQPPSAAVMVPPTAPNPPPADSPVAQPLTPRPGPVAGAVPAAPGVTSFVPPAQPFSPSPPPSGGRAAGLKPGMLNATALRGPVATVPPSTTSTSAPAAQPMAYVHPEPPRPIVPPSPPQPPLLNVGDTARTLNPLPHTQPTTSPPPAQLLTLPPPPHPPSPPAPQNSPPALSANAGGTGAQMLGTGAGGAPEAPAAPLPLDPQPTPPPPPPPVRGRAPEGVHPPVEGPLTPGPPSKAREQRKGAEHLWDDQGGEWRYHPEDSSHNPHWDYKPPGKNTEWQQIPIGGLPPMKGGVDPSLIAKLPPWMQNLLAPGVPGGPQNPLLAPYPGATMPAPPPTSAYVPPPDSGFFPPIDMPDLDPGSAMPIAGGEVVVIGGMLVLVIAGLIICLA
jgi:hypothetical protein